MADKLLMEAVQKRLHYKFGELEENVITIRKLKELHITLEKVSDNYFTQINNRAWMLPAPVISFRHLIYVTSKII